MAEDAPDDARQQFVSVAWLMSEEPLAPKDDLAFAVLNHLLLGTASSVPRAELRAGRGGAGDLRSARVGRGCVFGIALTVSKPHFPDHLRWTLGRAAVAWKIGRTANALVKCPSPP